MTDIIALARGIAFGAHAGQVDKSGVPYIKHCERVAARVGIAEEIAVAWLHDVIEDTEVTPGDLYEAGLPDHVIEAVIAITHRRNEPRAEYYRRVQANELAYWVKLADISDNADPRRLALLDKETRERLTAKYRKALEALAR